MKFDRKELLKSLSPLKPAVSSASSIVQLKHIWFEGNKAFAYNGGLGIKVDLKTGFKFAVLGAPLLKLLSDNSVDSISLEEKEGALVAKLGRATVELPTLGLDTSPWTFPDKPKILAELLIDETLQKALKRASLVKTSSPLRVEHYGVILFTDSGELLLYATDSRAMIEIASKPSKGALGGLNKIVLPFEFVEVLQSLDGGSLFVCKDCLIAESEGILVCSNLLDSSGVVDLPKLLGEIVQNSDEMIEFPDTLGDALSRADILADGGDVHLKLSVEKSQLSLDGKLALGSFKETIPLAKSSVKASIGIDGSLLRRVVNEGKQFAIVGERLVVEGEDNFIFVQASYSV